MRKVLETAVTHADAAIRSVAAEKLIDYERSEALLARWNDPETSVRLSVARSFRLRSQRGRNFLPPILPRDRDLLGRLAQDSDAGVRLEVLDVLLQHSQDIDDGLLEPYTRDVDSEVRKQFADKIWPNNLPLEGSLKLAARMADDPDVEVIQRIDSQLNRSLNSPNFEPSLPLFEARIASTRHPWRDTHDANLRRGYFAMLSSSSVGREWMARKGIEWNDAELLKALSRREALFLIAPELTAPYAQKLFAIDPEAVDDETAFVRAPGRDFENAREGVTRGLVELARDSTLDPRLRFLLATTDAKLAGSLVADTAIAALGDPRWKPGGPWGDSLWFRKALRNRMDNVPDSEHNRIALEVLARPDADPAMQAVAGDLVQPDAKDGAKVMQAVLERWFEDSSSWHASVGHSIQALGTIALPDGKDFLHRAVVEGRYLEEAAEAMGNSRDEAFLPDLAAILTTRVSQEDLRAWQWALGSLSSFLSDAAAETLLDVSARLTDAGYRTNVLNAVESIRTYQEARERWASRRLGKQTRERSDRRSRWHARRVRPLDPRGSGKRSRHARSDRDAAPAHPSAAGSLRRRAQGRTRSARPAEPHGGGGAGRGQEAGRRGQTVDEPTSSVFPLAGLWTTSVVLPG
jgi:hypothetical protein